MTGVLHGLRVVDFGRFVAGPYCATILGDLGAEVIRVERREGGEDRWLSPVADGGEGALFMQVARNKLGMTLDLQKPEGRDIVRRLVKTADVLTINSPVNQLPAMGLDYPSLKAIKEDIIVTMVSTFGSTGPYSNRVGFDQLGQAMSGSMYLTGDGETPVRATVPWVDFGSALYATIGTMSAIMERQRSGEGQLVEIALLHTALNFTNSHLIEQAVIAANRTATMNLAWTAGPSNTFRTKDGWIYTVVIGQSLFKRWCRMVGEDGWFSDPRFKDDPTRGSHGKILSDRMQRWCENRTTAQVLATLDEARIPCGPVLSPQGVLDNEHVKEANFLQPIDYPGLLHRAPIATSPIRSTIASDKATTRPPLLGEHTDRILMELGYSPAEIVAFRAADVV